MEEIVGIFDSIALILMGVIGGVAVISLGIAALLYMNAHGDPQQQKAKNAFIGIIMAGLAYVIPGIISDVIVTPAGGESLRVESAAADCDNLLKTQLVQRGNFPAGEAGHVGGGTVAGVGGDPRGIGGAGVFVRRRHEG